MKSRSNLSGRRPSSKQDIRGCERQRVVPPHPLAGARSHKNARGGFALLITVTLLAFIVILLLGLAAYTRVETSIAGNTQRQAQARQNALFALNVALAQLQKHAGPDTRVTATAAHFGAIDGTRHYTGVWSSDATATTGTPLTWLVSGNEIAQPDVPDPNPDAEEGSTVPAPLAVTPAEPGTRLQTLVGRNSSGETTRGAGWVDAPLVDITAPGVPGVAPSGPPATIGRYAWWVADQGVKAPVATSDDTAAVAFSPFNSAELHSRLRQQLPLGAGAVDAGGAPLFEPRDDTNKALVANGKVAATNQIGFLRTGANTQVGLARVQQNFHVWSPNNFAVLADTRRGGLRQDLSLVPTLLGNAFAAWANYPAYMEKFAPDVVEPPAGGESVEAEPAPAPTSTSPAILPAYGEDPVRRRYVMTPHLFAGNGSHQVGPILSHFFITFNVRTVRGSEAAGRPLEVRGGWMVSLWNPYTSALVPEKLRVEVRGLPDAVTLVDEANSSPVVQFSLRKVFGTDEMLRIVLPWTNEGDNATPDRQSWLPGRVYTWRSVQDTDSGNPVPAEGFEALFYSRNFGDNGPNQGVQRLLSSGVTIDGITLCRLEVENSQDVEVRVYAVRESGDVPLGRFSAPPFLKSFSTTANKISAGTYQFGYGFRLRESTDTPETPNVWLTTDQIDFRRSRVPQEAFVFERDDNPATYENTFAIPTSNPSRLLDRASNSFSYNEDVPIFELPRAPLVSLGATQHFRLVGQRPFMIGNPWGVNFELNDIRLGTLFDRFFFSGVTAGVVPAAGPTGDLVLPNILLKPLRKADGTKVTSEDVRPTPVVETEPTEPPPVEEPPVETTPIDPAVAERIAATRTSKHFLQGGAFNLNSTNAAAWAAILRNVRFPAPQSFTYLDVSPETGTAGDTVMGSIQSDDAQFFRFSQSAQETYKAEPGMADNATESVSPANTHLFRRGMRTLTAAEVTALAAKIAELVGLKHTAADALGGPFRSLEDFLSPSALFAGVDSEGNALAPRSMLEAAIADVGINSAIPEFSSQWLTQGDVMTSLAPVLFPRSDTFVVRTYGETVNPATNAVEGRAWAEAIVQRLPDYFDSSISPEAPVSAFDPVSNPDDPEAPATSTPAQELNKLFGRRFKVISFRWLTRADI